ncbi:MAG: TerB family tellurite resistance protein [Myxococcota bacterium]
MGIFDSKSDTFGINVFGQTAKETFDASKLAEGFRNRPGSDVSIPEAYLTLLLAAAGADGSLGPEERQLMLWISQRSRVLRHLSVEALAHANENVLRRAQAGGDVLLDACNALPGDIVPSAFAHCIQLTLADGELGHEESRFIQELAEALKIPQADASKILEVLLIAAS